MGKAVVTLKVMPESPEIDLEELESFCEEKVESFANPDQIKIKREPVAFGLKALVIQFVMGEDQGNTDELEETLSEHEDVRGAETTDVRRTLG